MKGISFDYPTWYILFCLLAGLAYALVLYFRDKTFKEQATWFTWLLGILRFLSVSLLAGLLLSPILRSKETRTQKPVVVIAQDGSESIRAAWTAQDSQLYVTQLLELKDKLAEDYDVVSYTFGENLKDTLDFSFNDKRTNLSAVMQEVYDLYSNQNLGALILATDGIYNEGANPVYSDINLNAPVYTIGLGDTTRYKDLNIKRVFHNKIAYLGDKFSIQVDISGQNASGTSVPIFISRIENGRSRQIIREQIQIDRNDFFTTREFILNADIAGVNRYRISIGTIDGEQSTLNNNKDIYVDILEARKKVLILAHAPHPDLSALKQSLSEGLNNEVSVAYISSFKENIRDFDLVILHQLPSKAFPAKELMAELKSSKTPVFYIIGQQNSFNALNNNQGLVNILSNGKNTNDVEPKMATSFSLFNISDDVREAVQSFPPLVAPFGEFSEGTNASVLFYQRIGRINTEYPLLSLGEQSGIRSAILCGTGIWKWRLFDYLEKKNHNRFNELLSQISQYLSVKSDKRQFRVSLNKNIFDENEPIIFDAELYNDSYELINEPSAHLVITDADGKEYTYTFNATGNVYRLNAGILPVGAYRYKATTNTGTASLNFSGQFSVQAVQVERYDMTANHSMLRLLSENYGGDFLVPSEITSLDSRLEDRGTVKPIVFETLHTRSVINLKGIFFLVLGLLSLEWFLRRYFGAY